MKKIKILGISIWKLLGYFIIYSFLGYIIETLFALITEGIWESRQSFLYGPFCAIYGLGAVVMILFLQYFNKNKITLFLGGVLIGSTTEYLLSFLGDKFLHVVWWDYSDMPLNINGRICLFFSIFWGILAMALVKYINPKIDDLLEKIKTKVPVKWLKIIIVAIIIFLIFDFFISNIAVELFYARMVHNYDINVPNREKFEETYNLYYSNESVVKITKTLFSDKKMITTFPNLKMYDVDGNVLYFENYLPDIKNYYYKFDSGIGGQIYHVVKVGIDKLKNIGNNLLGTINMVIKGE